MKKVKVMFVGTSSTDLERLSKIVRKAGYESTSCTSLDTSISLILSEKPHILVLDLDDAPVQPDDYIQKLKQRSINLPTVVISKNRTKEDVLRIKAAGAIDYILKPINPEIFINRIERIGRPLKEKIEQEEKLKHLEEIKKAHGAMSKTTGDVKIFILPPEMEPLQMENLLLKVDQSIKEGFKKFVFDLRNLESLEVSLLGRFNYIVRHIIENKGEVALLTKDNNGIARVIQESKMFPAIPFFYAEKEAVDHLQAQG